MVLIYSENTSTRLQYTCKFIFEEILGTTFNLTLHAESFSAHEGTKICYSDQRISATAYHIRPYGLLSETGLRQHEAICTGEGENKIFFGSANADHSFDIFSAVFYLVSRYEEYLPHTEDEYGRYAHTNSVAFKNNFLHIPLVNIWIQKLGDSLQNFGGAQPSTFNFSKGMPSAQPSIFSFLPTYDIDMAWSYKEKGFLRIAAGLVRRPSSGRIASLLGMQRDPFDSYSFLNKLHADAKLRPIYFFLVAKATGLYDKNISPSNESMKRLIKSHAEQYAIALHPSWKSNENEELLTEEKSTLEKISGKPVNASRQHYIKFKLPGTFENLIAAGIKDDYSMGYGSINGFRASAASSFFWYDLSKEQITSLRIHPFCFMDANCFYEEKLGVEQSYNELMYYYTACKKVNGTLITIFHNSFLGTDKAFAGWPELYTQFTSQLQ